MKVDSIRIRFETYHDFWIWIWSDSWIPSSTVLLIYVSIPFGSRMNTRSNED